MIEKLTRIATYAPSGHNVQPANWLVIYESDHVGRMIELTLECLQDLIRQMPDFAKALHVPEVVEATMDGRDKIFRGAPHVILCHAPADERTAPMGCVIALAHFELAASALGLGACWCGYFNYATENYPPMQEALNLPEGHKNYGALAIGYPKFQYHRIPPRKAPRITWR